MEWRARASVYKTKNFNNAKLFSAQPDPSKPLYIAVDVSSTGIAEYLGQGAKEQNTILQYTSRLLKESERTYPTERECLAIVYIIKQFSSFFKGRPFTIYTDHNNLKWLRVAKDWNARIFHWGHYIARIQLRSYLYLRGR